MGLGQIYSFEKKIWDYRKKRTVLLCRTFYAMRKETSLKMGWTKLVRGIWTELVKWYLASCPVNLEDIKY
jgi:hypothetical protein